MTPGVQDAASQAEAPLIAAFRNGFEEAAGRQWPGPELWKRADMMWYIQRLVRMVSIHDYYNFEALYKLAWDSGAPEGEQVDIPALFVELSQREENKRLLEELREEDWPQEIVEMEERAAFGADMAACTDRVAVARKLTLMSTMNERFVADRRLWQWLEDALKDEE